MQVTLVETPVNIERLLQIARGDRPADLLFRDTRLVNVFAGEVVRTDFAVADGHVVGFGTYAAEEVIDLAGRIVAPGFIDAHVHIESAMVGPAQFARAVLPQGTTTVIADPHEIANVLGSTGIDYMLTAGRHAPLNFFFSLPSCVPATHMETAGARLTTAELSAYATHPRIVALAEMMNYPGVVNADPDVLAKIATLRAAGKPVDGHAPGLAGALLHAYLVPGIGSDHECTTAAEATEKLAAGMHIMVREGTGARNLNDLLPMITDRTARRMMWCTDDRHCHDLLAQGHIAGMMRRAVDAGMDPIVAIQMATLNPAEYFRLDRVGAVAPGRRADLVVLDDLRDPQVRDVYFGGRLAARDGQLVEMGFATPVDPVPSSMHVAADQLDFRVPATGRRMRMIQVVPDQIVTRSIVVDAVIREGLAVADPDQDIAKIAVVERHQGSGRIGLGFVRGFGLRRGTLAGTVAHDSHNIIVVGVRDADMHAAVVELVHMGGGLVAVDQGKTIARLALPVAGLMSGLSVEGVCGRLDGLLDAARGLGTSLADPFMTLSFMALPVIPDLKLTDHGLVDVGAFNVVPLFV